LQRESHKNTEKEVDGNSCGVNGLNKPNISITML